MSSGCDVCSGEGAVGSVIMLVSGSCRSSSVELGRGISIGAESTLRRSGLRWRAVGAGIVTGFVIRKAFVHAVNSRSSHVAL